MTKLPLIVVEKGGSPGSASLAGQCLVAGLFPGASGCGGLGGRPGLSLLQRGTCGRAGGPCRRTVTPRPAQASARPRGTSGRVWSVLMLSNYSCLQFCLTSPCAGALGLGCPVVGVGLRTDFLAEQGELSTSRIQVYWESRGQWSQLCLKLPFLCLALPPLSSYSGCTELRVSNWLAAHRLPSPVPTAHVAVHDRSAEPAGAPVGGAGSVPQVCGKPCAGKSPSRGIVSLPHSYLAGSVLLPVLS